jgi:hypothetical protein
MALTMQNVHIDAALSDYAIGYGQQPGEYIGSLLAPPLNVQKVTDKYWVGDKSAYGDTSTFLKRAPGAEFARIEWSVSTDSYSAEGYGVEVPVIAEIAANADSAINMQQGAVRLAVARLQMDYERRVAAMMQSTSLFTNYSATADADRFDTPTSDPIGMVQDAKDNMAKKIGVRANTIWMGYEVMSKLRQHPEFVERAKYTRLVGQASMETLKEMFEVDNIYVGAALYNTAIEGATVSLDYIWGKNLGVCYIDNRSGPMDAQIVTPARTFVWAGSPTSGRFSVATYYEPQRMTDIVQCTDYTDEKVIELYSQYLFTTVID